MIFLLYLGIVGFSALLSRAVFRGRYFSLGLGLALQFFVALLLQGVSKDLSVSAWGTALAGGVALLLAAWKGGFRGARLRPHLPILAYGLAWAVYYFAFQGAYVEIPSDAVGVHLYRIGEWLKLGHVPLGVAKNGLGDSTLYYGYLLQAAAVRLSPWDRAVAADLIAFFNTVTLSAAVYLCAYHFLRRGWLAAFAVFLAHLLWGTEVYPFFRYYAFAPSLLNMVLVIDAIAVSRLLARERRSVALLGILGTWLAMAALTHKQEMIFLAFIAAAAMMPLVFSGRRRRWAAAALAVGALAFAAAAIQGWIRQKIGVPGYFQVLAEIGAWKIVVPEWASLAPTFNRSLQVAVGVSACGFLAAMAVRRGRPRDDGSLWVFGLTLAPVALAFFPLSASILSFAFYDLVYYRILYLAPVFIAVPLALATLWRIAGAQSSIASRVARAAVVAAGVAVTMLGAGANTGRGTYFFHPAQAADGFKQWMPVYRDLEAYRTGPAQYVFTDPVTGYGLNYVSGFYTPFCDRDRCRTARNWWKRVHGRRWLRRKISGNHFVLANTTTGFTRSRLAAHWDPNVRDIGQYLPHRYAELLDELEGAGELERVRDWPGFILYRVNAARMAARLAEEPTGG